MAFFIQTAIVVLKTTRFLAEFNEALVEKSEGETSIQEFLLSFVNFHVKSVAVDLALYNSVVTGRN